jgi:hypothetical protein
MTKLRGFVRRRRAPVEEYVCIPRYQTAKLRTFNDSKGSGPEVVIFRCPTCPDRDKSRLVQVDLSTESRYAYLEEGYNPKKARQLTVLLHVTRDQVSQILRELDSGPSGVSGDEAPL